MPEMGTSADVQDKAVVDSHPSNDYDDESQISSANPPPEEKSLDEPTYDTGLLAWSQVIGSFFLFFNSWYALLIGSIQ